MSEVIQNSGYSWFKERMIRQWLLWSAVYVMITRKVSFQWAVDTIRHEYYMKCIDTGQPNILYRRADPSLGEIGPQNRIERSFDWWLVIIIALVLRWLYKKYKK